MRRLVTAMVDVGDRVLFLYGDPRVLERAGETADGSPEVIRLIERGQAAGVFDSGGAWIEQVLWALVYAGCAAAGRGTLPRHAVATPPTPRRSTAPSPASLRRPGGRGERGTTAAAGPADLRTRHRPARIFTEWARDHAEDFA